MERELSQIFVGVGVSSAHLNVTLHPSESEQVFPNTDIGVATLATYLQTLQPKVIAVESTGGDEWPLVVTLLEATLPVIIVNPRQVRDFARATGLSATSNASEARVLARFAETVRVAV